MMLRVLRGGRYVMEAMHVKHVALYYLNDRHLNPPKVRYVVSIFNVSYRLSRRYQRAGPAPSVTA